MSAHKTFCVSWQTGRIVVNVSTFFGSSNQKEINKLLKLARVYCDDDQRIALLSDLEDAKRERNEAILAMAAVQSQTQKRELAEPFFPRDRLFNTRNYEKATKIQCNRIEACINKIKVEAWQVAKA